MVRSLYSREKSLLTIVTQNTLQESQLYCAVYCPHQKVVEVMKEDPVASKKCVISQVKTKIHWVDTAAKLACTTSLPVQGFTVRELEEYAAQNWWKKLYSPRCQLCGEYQSLTHVLNTDTQPATLHHQAQQCAESHCRLHQMPSAWQDAHHWSPPRGQYDFPKTLPPLTCHLEQSGHLHLTVPFETNISDVAERKIHRYLTSTMPMPWPVTLYHHTGGWLKKLPLCRGVWQAVQLATSQD